MKIPGWLPERQSKGYSMLASILTRIQTCFLGKFGRRLIGVEMPQSCKVPSLRLLNQRQQSVVQMKAMSCEEAPISPWLQSQSHKPVRQQWNQMKFVVVFAVQNAASPTTTYSSVPPSRASTAAYWDMWAQIAKSDRVSERRIAGGSKRKVGHNKPQQTPEESIRVDRTAQGNRQLYGRFLLAKLYVRQQIVPLRSRSRRPLRCRSFIISSDPNWKRNHTSRIQKKRWRKIWRASREMAG